MRNELNNIEKIERYLQGTMSAEERMDFEKAMAADPALKEEVRLQAELVKGIKTLSLKKTARQSYNKYRLGKGLKKWGGIGGGIILITAATYFAWNYFGGKSNDREIKISYELPELNENGEKSWADADKYLPYQLFSIDNSKDTVIETQDGIVMAIPAACFLDQEGKPVNGEVQLEVKEAIKSDDILRSGLSTRSGNTPLETGGMFYLNARKEGESLKIDPAKGIVTQVPTDEVKPGMQVYEGKRMPDGSIDWIKPKELEKFLVPVDIHSLNFYPPNYEDTLSGLSKRAGDQIYRDSLYYSFADLFGASGTYPDSASVLAPIMKDTFVEPVPTNPDRMNVVFEREHDHLSKEENDRILKRYYETYPSSMYWVTAIVGTSEDTDYYLHIWVYKKNNIGINPAKVKAIWNNKFNNTILATKAFEERMISIHLSCNNAILDLYVNNLDKKLCTIDSMAAQVDGRFMEFAQRGDGRVQEENAGHIAKLKKYYADKTKAYTEAAEKTRKSYLKQQQKAEEKFGAAQNEHFNQEVKRNADNFIKEYTLNLDEALRQLGYPKKIPVAPIPNGTYTAVVTMPGWKNIDRAVLESTMARTTLDYTDPVTGKTAVIKYEEVSITIENRKEYDALFVYAIPDQLNSFMRIKEESAVFTEKLNELMQHEMVCVAYKGEQAYLYYQEKLNPGKYEGIALKAVSKKELNQQLSKIKQYGQEQKLLEELSFRHIEQKENLRQKKVRDQEDFRERIRQTIFPCAEPAPATDTTAVAEMKAPTNHH